MPACSRWISTTNAIFPSKAAGCVARSWSNFPRPCAFDYATISDLVLHLRYTARDGGGSFRTMVANGIAERLNLMALKTNRTGLFQAFDLRRDRPDTWHRLVTTGTASLTITAGDLPYFTSGRAVAITVVRILARVKGAPANYARSAERP
jgi:hypothetical protein